MIDDEMYETCKDCPYYYGEINQCMYGEEDVPDDLKKKCQEGGKEMIKEFFEEHDNLCFKLQHTGRHGGGWLI